MDNIIQLKTEDDYINLDTDIMYIIVFDIYYNIVYNKNIKYTNDAIDEFYIFLDNLCEILILRKKTRTALSVLLCLSCMMQDDKMLTKSHHHLIFINNIQMNFYNWLVYKKVRSNSYVGLFVNFMRECIFIKFNKKYNMAMIEIKKYCKNIYRHKYPDILYLYDRKKIQMRNKNSIIKI